MIERTINVYAVEHRETHLLVAMSDDLPGLMVAARSEEQLERELPDAIREVLEAEGRTVLGVETEPLPRLGGGFVKRTMTASARLAA